MKSKLNFSKSSHIHADHHPPIVLIPGGPCFSSQTLSDLEPLSDQFNLVFLDPPGTGGTDLVEPLSYDTLLIDIEAAIANLSVPVILFGHSFGGIQAMEMTIRRKIPVAGLIAMATPFTQLAFEASQTQYLKYRTEAMQKAEKEFEECQSEENFLKLNLTYWPYYFTSRTKEKGCELLRQDKTCYKLFLAATAEGQNKGHLLDELRTMDVPKLSLAGEEDLMFPVPVLKTEAERGGFEFAVIPRAGHFTALDEPSAVCSEIKKFI